VTGVLERRRIRASGSAGIAPSERGCVLGDPSQLDQVVMTWPSTRATHAPWGQLKFTPNRCDRRGVLPGGGTGCPPGSIFSLRRRYGRRHFPGEHGADCFDPFFTTRPRERDGARPVDGLRIVKNHGGCVDVRSEAGAGTGVQVYLPESPEVVRRRRRMGHGPPSRRGRILLVDDQEPVRRWPGTCSRRWATR